MTWLYKNHELQDEELEDFVGFVYKITNTTNGRIYFGRKLLTKAKTLPPLKGMKRKRRSRVESDWREYWGSSKEVLEDISLLGPNCFTREIIRLCKSKSEMSYYEVKYIVEGDALLYPDRFYNGNIMCKINRVHMLPKKPK